MKRLAVVLLLLGLGLASCITTIQEFIPSSHTSCPPKAADYEVTLYFEGDRPAREYRVLGLIYAESYARNNIVRVQASDVLEGLREEARVRGADAVIDVKIMPVEFRRFDTKRGEGKAIIFLPTAGPPVDNQK